jgi:hypothetical protein
LAQLSDRDIVTETVIEEEMEAAVGDRIIIESNRVGASNRTGEIVEVVDDETGRHFRVRWDDGHDTVFFPSSGGATIEHAPSA